MLDHRPLIRRPGLWLFLGLLLPLRFGHALPPAVDLAAEAAMTARRGQPLIVLFSREDCRYCETVRRQFLEPLARQPAFKDGIREIRQDAATNLADFSGQSTTHERFAKAQKIRLVPVVAFYGPQGERLAAPIVGLRLPDFYQSYLDSALEEARRQLGRPAAQAGRAP